MNFSIVPMFVLVSAIGCKQSEFSSREKKVPQATGGISANATLEEKRDYVISSLMNAPLAQLHETMIKGSTDAPVVVQGVVFEGLRSLLEDMRDAVQQSTFTKLADFYGDSMLEPTREFTPEEKQEVLMALQEKFEDLRSLSLARSHRGLSLKDDCGKFQYISPDDQLSTYQLVRDCGAEVGTGAWTEGPEGAAKGVVVCQVGYVEQIISFTNAEDELRECEAVTKRLTPESAMSKKPTTESAPAPEDVPSV